MRARGYFIAPFVIALIAPTFLLAAELVNINTADAALLDTLPGIGPAYAGRIVDYRTAHGPFAKTGDIQNVSGIGPSTYAKIAALITVGDTAPASAPATTTPQADPQAIERSAESPASSTGNASPEYMPIPALRIIADGDRTVSSGADTAFVAAVYDGKGNRRDDALVTWTFGDGMQSTSARVFHRYYYPGAYIVVVHATTSDGGEARKEISLTAKDAGIRITAVSTQGIELKNEDTRTLDLSFWRLSAGGKEFKLPEGTQILHGSSVIFPSQVTGIPLAGAASLLYPSGEIAAEYPASSVRAGEQPSAPPASYKEVQKVEQITSTKGNDNPHDEAVIAPAPADSTVGAGAALDGIVKAPAPAAAALAEDAGEGTKVLKSPWTFGLLGVVMLAGGAFILL